MAMEGLVGRTLGKYRIVEQLGRGGMAEVYKAYQAGLDRYVAIKVMHSFLSEDKDFLARFQREAKLVASMRHPNIVQVHDFDVEAGSYYMVMEYIDGETLKSRLQKLEERNQWISIDEAVRMILAVGSALKYAHRMGMVHRDVKPANVMVDKTGNVILTDFGIAKIFAAGAQTQLTAAGAMIGTPSYMSPEQGMGQPGDERSDIYSLSVMLYQLVTGRLPFEADTPLAVVIKHINDPLPMPRQVNPEVPEPVERIIFKGMAKNPDDRYQHVGDMLNDLKRAMGMSLDETPTDTMRARALPAGATAVATGAITPFPSAARRSASTTVKPLSGPTVISRPMTGPSAAAVPRAGPSKVLFAVGGVAVVLIVVIVVAVALAMSSGSGVQTASATQTAQAMVAAKLTPTVSATSVLQPTFTSTPSSALGVVKAGGTTLRSSYSESSSAIGLLPQGARLTVRARTADNAWLRVEAADGSVGWVAVNAVDINTRLTDIPQSILQDIPTQTPNLTATPAACKPDAKVADVTVPYGSQFNPGAIFVKRWRFTSSGNCPWEKGSMLVLQSGDKLDASSTSLPVDAVDVGKSVEVSVTLKAPTTPGSYVGQWTLQQPSGQVITTADVSIVVPAPTATRGPVPTAAPATSPAATATPRGGAIGPVGTGSLEASYVGWTNCVARLDTETDGWVWEADFAVEVHGGSAGYTASSSNCRWDFGQLKFFCRWGGRDGVPMAQSVTISCPNCKPARVDVFVTIKHKGASGCE